MLRSAVGGCAACGRLGEATTQWSARLCGQILILALTAGLTDAADRPALAMGPVSGSTNTYLAGT